MGLCAIAPGPGAFAAFRFLAGLGLGGVMPTTVALTVEWAPPQRQHLFNALMFSGFSVGGIAAALLALWLLPHHGFRLLFAFGMVPIVTVVPLARSFLPESRAFHRPLAGSGRRRARDSAAALFAPSRLAASLLFPLASFFGLLLVFGLNTWLPKIMQKAGYPLTSALAFLVALNVGAVLGAVSGSTVADRFGAKPVAIAGFLVAAGAVLLMSRGLPLGPLYVVVAAAGCGSVGTQILINGYVAGYFGPEHRASALGWTLGVGRLGAILGPTLGGYLLASNLGVTWNFYTFAAAALCGAAAVAAVPQSPPLH
jgi:AAHS family benzoate transporter-like MFS transporter